MSAQSQSAAIASLKYCIPVDTDIVPQLNYTPVLILEDHYTITYENVGTAP
jgi:hypothetical protein